jgi:NADH:ubiquinone oxidoreductase subunit 6 (subunit J)
MTRVNAALLAGAVTVLLFAAVMVLVNWLTGTVGFGRAISSPLFAVGVIVFNCVVIVPLVVWRQHRAKREERDALLTPPMRRPPSTGRRGL